MYRTLRNMRIQWYTRTNVTAETISQTKYGNKLKYSKQGRVQSQTFYFSTESAALSPSSRSKFRLKLKKKEKYFCELETTFFYKLAQNKIKKKCLACQHEAKSLPLHTSFFFVHSSATVQFVPSRNVTRSKHTKDIRTAIEH